MKVGVIGVGRLGSSLITGWLRCRVLTGGQLIVNSRISSKRFVLEGIVVPSTRSKSLLVEESDVVVIATGPQQVEEVCVDIKQSFFRGRPTIVSLAAGVHTADIERWLGTNDPIIRAMTSLPVSRGLGTSFIYSRPDLSQHRRDLVDKLFNGVGDSVWIPDESQIDAHTVLFSCAPAFYAYLTELLQEISQEMHIDVGVAKRSLQQMILGSAILLKDEKDVGSFRRRVSTPGGVTERAISGMRELKPILRKALIDACDRCKEIDQEISGGGGVAVDR